MCILYLYRDLQVCMYANLYTHTDLDNIRTWIVDNGKLTVEYSEKTTAKVSEILNKTSCVSFSGKRQTLISPAPQWQNTSVFVKSKWMDYLLKCLPTYQHLISKDLCQTKGENISFHLQKKALKTKISFFLITTSVLCWIQYWSFPKIALRFWAFLAMCCVRGEKANIAI